MNLCLEALFLIRLLNQLQPKNAEIEGALALMLMTDARRFSRIHKDGRSLPITEQDHALWNAEFIDEGRKILAIAISRHTPGPFQIKAAIADCHMMKPEPDWAQMLYLYQSLWHHEPTPVVALNWAVVMAECDHEKLALEKLKQIQKDLSDFQPWYAAQAYILVKLGQVEDAKLAYQSAIKRTSFPSEKMFLKHKLSQLK